MKKFLLATCATFVLANSAVAQVVPIPLRPGAAGDQNTMLNGLITAINANFAALSDSDSGSGVGSDIYGNIVIGTGANPFPPQTGSPNTVVGTNSLADFTPAPNKGGITAFGDQSGQHLTAGRADAFFGHRAGFNGGTQGSNTFLGAFAGVGSDADPLRIVNYTGGNNVCVGEAACLNIAGYSSSNIAVGFNALFSSLYILSNTAVGTGALGSAAINSKQSTAVGEGAGRFMAGDANTVLGAVSGNGSITFHTFTGNASTGSYAVPFSDTSWATLGDPVDSGSFFLARDTIYSKDATHITLANGAFATSVLGTGTLTNSRTGLVLYPTDFVPLGTAVWRYSDTSFFLVGDTVTSSILTTGSATVLSIVPGISITLSQVTNSANIIGTKFFDRMVSYTAMPTAVTNSTTGRATYTFANGTSWATVGDVVSVPGFVYDSPTIMGIVANTAITFSQPLTQDIVADGVEGIYDIPDLSYGSNNVLIGFAAGNGISGPASGDIYIGALAAPTLTDQSEATVIGSFQTSAVISGPVGQGMSILTLSNAAGQTLTPAQILPGVLKRSGAGAVTDTTPSADDILASMPGAERGTGWEFTLINNDSDTLTLAAGTGVTLLGTPTTATLQARRFLVRVGTTSPNTVTIQSEFTAAP